MDSKISTLLLSIILAIIIIINFMYNIEVVDRLDKLSKEIQIIQEKEVILECNP